MSANVLNPGLRGHRDDLREAVRPERAPALTLVVAQEEVAVAKRCHEALLGRRERVWHRLERTWKPEVELLPGAFAPPAVERGVRRRTRPMRVKGTGRGGDEPAVGIEQVDRERPGVVAVAAIVGFVPGLAVVATPGRPAAGGLVRAARLGRMPRERVHVALGTGTVVLPGRAAVGRAHEPAELDSGEDSYSLVRARRDPADVRRPRARREAPRRSGRKVAEC